MGKWTIHKFISLVAFLAMTVIFFIWSSQQVSDLTLLFGLRTSHTVANDIAGIITSLGAVPGDVTARYSLYPGTSGEKPVEGETLERNAVKYDIRIFSKSVCVTSVLGDIGRASTDCASHPFEISEERFEGSSICLEFSKKDIQPREEGKPPSVLSVRKLQREGGRC
jgi:hypothetical protein